MPTPLDREFGPNSNLSQRIKDYRATKVLNPDFGIEDSVIDTFIVFLREFFATSQPYGATQQDVEVDESKPNLSERYRLYYDSEGGMDLEKSGIIIVDSDTVDPDLYAKRPAIVIDMVSSQFLGLGLDQYEGGSMAGEDKIHRDLVMGQLQLRAYSSVKNEARILANWVRNIVLAYTPSLCRMGQIHAIERRITVGRPSTGGQFPSSDTENIAVPVGVTWYKAYKWRTGYVQPDPLLADITMTSRTRIGKRIVISLDD
ncbi:hypothetical protein LCGC14_0146800 [marine sediment metagenome]|uniref:Uncharacterized protein n=1 Tax=marine sediment metagenome TaxID=412755 RepID=A0A0F9Y1J1_9ZZZZ